MSRRRGAAEPCFLDANILMYAGGGDHPLKKPCQRALERAVAAEARLFTDAEVLQEILYRYFSIGRPVAARTVYRAALRVTEDVLPIDHHATSRALELLEGAPELSPRDAIHVATMERAGLTLLLSTDSDFDDLPQVTRVSPRDFLR